MKDTMVKSYECPICHEEITAEKLAILPEDEHELHEELLGNIGDHMFSCHEAKRTPDAEQLEARIAELEKPILCAKCNDHIIADDGAVCEICADTMDTIITELQTRNAELEAMHDHQHLLDLADEAVAAKCRIAELEKLAVVWHKYPDEKPDKDGWYITSYKGQIRRHFWDSRRAVFDTNPTDIPYVENTQPTHYAEYPAPPEEK